LILPRLDLPTPNVGECQQGGEAGMGRWMGRWGNTLTTLSRGWEEKVVEDSRPNYDSQKKNLILD